MNKPLSRRSVTVAENGRMNLPADLRRRLGMNGAGRIVIEEYDDHFEIRSFEQRMKRVDELMKPYLQPGRSMVDELLQERREEVAREEAEFAEACARNG